jgi:hypothetical protein
VSLAQNLSKAMKKNLSVLHYPQWQKKNKRSLSKELTMSNSEHPLLEQAFQYAENCMAEANATVDFLDQATEVLHEEDPEFREAVSQSLIKADQLIDHCAQIVQDLLELRLKYRAAHSTSGLSPNIDALTETLARIELRRRIENHMQE